MCLPLLRGSGQFRRRRCGGIVGEEEFLLWDPPRAMAFCFTATNAPGQEAFGELYERNLTQAHQDVQRARARLRAAIGLP